MKLFTNKKYNTLTLYILLIVIISLLMIFALFKIDSLLKLVGKLVKVLMPIIWGFIIAYLLNPIMISFEKIVRRFIFNKKPHDKATRRISVVLTTLAMFMILAALIYFIIPQVIQSVQSIFENFNIWTDNIKNFSNSLFQDHPELKEFIDSEFDTITEYFQGFITKLEPEFNKMLTNLTKGVFAFLIGLKDFLLGLIVSIYLLLSKEKLISQFKKTTLALFSKRTCMKLFSIGNKSNKMFMGFISGKIIDSIIICLICFISMSILNLTGILDTDFVILISVIIGVTNIIPFFGPFIGAIPSAFLILLENPIDTIPFLIFVLILQQFDGNILGPRILGDSTGLPAFWVLFAIFLGGGLFGFAGMLLGVPVFALIYSLFRGYVENRLEFKNMPKDTVEYSGNVEKYYMIKRAKDIKEDNDFNKYLQDRKK